MQTNVIFRDQSGNRSDAHLLAFEDTWHWGPSAEHTARYLTSTACHSASREPAADMTDGHPSLELLNA